MYSRLSDSNEIMTHRFEETLLACPVIAILRGVTPKKVIDVCKSLIETGVKIIEVPLNSPEPYASIELIKNTFEKQILCGAGTVSNVQQIHNVRLAGGDIALSPHMDTKIIDACFQKEMLYLPGIATPTEAFAAIQAGAKYLKVFPAVSLDTSFVSALQAVIPPKIKLIAVGGLTPGSITQWLQAGACGVGIGSDLYHPNDNNIDFEQKLTQLRKALAAH
jgi:2-dehydro-3-deoxyphosphogalactonate aldolase